MSAKPLVVLNPLERHTNVVDDDLESLADSIIACGLKGSAQRLGEYL